MITVARLKERLDYSPTTGVFVWRIRHGYGAKVSGKQAGGVLDPTKNSSTIFIDGKRYPTSHLVWLYCHGELPEKPLVVDHIDGNPANNRISNLRLATKQQNSQNRKRGRNNKSGFKGVQQIRWRATIKDGPKNRDLGCYNTPEEAYAVYKAEAQKLFGQFARFDEADDLLCVCPCCGAKHRRGEVMSGGK
jgi:hypothetical protein